MRGRCAPAARAARTSATTGRRPRRSDAGGSTGSNGARLETAQLPRPSMWRCPLRRRCHSRQRRHPKQGYSSRQRLCSKRKPPSRQPPCSRQPARDGCTRPRARGAGCATPRRGATLSAAGSAPCVQAARHAPFPRARPWACDLRPSVRHPRNGSQVLPVVAFSSRSASACNRRRGLNPWLARAHLRIVNPIAIRPASHGARTRMIYAQQCLRTSSSRAAPPSRSHPSLRRSRRLAVA